MSILKSAQQIELACLLEATARKPGNVHPGAAFSDLSYDDFVLAAKAVGQPLADVRTVGLGQAVFNAVEATYLESKTNVNLGIALLIAPLASVPETVPLPVGIRDVLNRTTIEDSEYVYAAIRLAKPGGMGDASSQDVKDRPTVTLRDAMALAADRDRIAEQYATDFAFILESARHWLIDAWHQSNDLGGFGTLVDGMMPFPDIVRWEAAILRMQLRILADKPDSHVVRKCGADVGCELQERAINLLKTGWPDEPESWPLYLEFDNWLRSDGHRRNPGTTADLIAATLFVALRDRMIEFPSRNEVLNHASTIRKTSSLPLS